MARSQIYRLQDSDNSAGGPGPRVARGLGVGVASPAEVVLSRVQDQRPADDVVGAGEGDDAIDDVDARDAVAAGLNVAEVSHVTVLVLGRSVALLLRDNNIHKTNFT